MDEPLSFILLDVNLFFIQNHNVSILNQAETIPFRSALKVQKQLEKSISNFFFRFAPNASIWLLMIPNGFPSTPRTPKHLLEAPMHPMNTLKIFDKIDFWAWKWIFQASRLPRLEKTHFWANFKGQNFFTDFISWPTTPKGTSMWPNEKICRADFWFNTYFLKKVIFCILMLKKLAKS